MKTQSKYFIIVVVLAIFFITLIVVSRVLAESPQTKTMDSYYKALSEKVEKGVKGPIGGWHYYWKDGSFSVDSREENIKFRINGQILIDGGDIDADDELQNAFPDLDGSEMLFRKLSVSTYRNFYDTVDFKIGIDFANARDIQDIWIRYLKHPFLKKIKFGNQKEPFSMEYLTSISRVTFMERALPTAAFGSGRNIGIRYDSLNPDRRINWGAGVFLNTGSFSTVGDGADQISQANGFDVTARVFGLPVNDENGKKMLHLGLGYSYGSRDENDLDSPIFHPMKGEWGAWELAFRHSYVDLNDDIIKCA